MVKKRSLSETSASQAVYSSASPDADGQSSVINGHGAKLTHLASASVDTESRDASSKPTMRCFLPPHPPLTFSTYDDYNVHYNKSHVNRCAECQRNLPSDHFLDLHIAENHDSLVAARKAREEKTYACFVEGCDKLCSTHFKRRLHLMDKHGFPRNYDFFIVNDGIDRRKSMLRPPRHRKYARKHCLPHAEGKPDTQPSFGKTARQREQAGKARQEPDSSDGKGTSSASDSEDDADSEAGSSSDESQDPPVNESFEAPAKRPIAPDRQQSSSTRTSRSGEAALTPSSGASAGDGMDGLTKSMSALKFVPPSIRFGRGRGKGGLARR